jgi:DNA-binding CsgD family transcriptional regulator/GAF domain-containing protein
VLSSRRARAVLGAVATIQGAASVREVQLAWLRSASDVVPAAGYGFYLLDPSSLRPVEVAASVPDRFLQRYEDEGRQDDPVLQEAVARRGPIDSSRLDPLGRWQSSAVCAVLREAGYHHSLEAPIIVDGVVEGTLNMARRQEEEPFSSEDLSALGVVAEQVAAAVTRARRYDQVSERTVLLADALDAASQPVVVTTVDGELIFRNRMALRAVPGSEQSYLDRAHPVLHQALEQLRQGHQRVVTAEEPSRQHLGARGSAHGAGPTPGALAVKAVRLRSRHDAVVSFVSYRPAGAPGLPDAAVPLSPREREIADLVSQGLTTRQIAELSYVSENTVKQHLKRIFAKLQVSSRAELVQAVWRAAAGHPGSAAGPLDQGPLDQDP